MPDVGALALALATLVLVVVLNRGIFARVPAGKLVRLALIWAGVFGLGLLSVWVMQ
jgi:hypothetical protein